MHNHPELWLRAVPLSVTVAILQYLHYSIYTHFLRIIHIGFLITNIIYLFIHYSKFRIQVSVSLAYLYLHNHWSVNTLLGIHPPPLETGYTLA